MDIEQFSRETWEKFHVNLNKQMHAVPNTQKAGESAIYRCDNYQDNLFEYPEDYKKTLLGLLQQKFETHASSDMLGTRSLNPKTGKWGPFKFLTYYEVSKKVNYIRSGLMHLMEEHIMSDIPEDDIQNVDVLKSIGIYGPNRLEWVLTDMACIGMNVTSVGLFDTYGQDVLEYVLNHSDVRMVVASGNLIYRLLRTKEQIPKLKVIVSMDPLPKDAPAGSPSHILRNWAESKGIHLYDFGEVDRLGYMHPEDPYLQQPGHVITLCYTSGTTGHPKAAMITNKNLMDSAGYPEMIAKYEVKGKMVYLNYLPLSHCMERLATYMSIATGGTVGIWRGEPKYLLEDIYMLRPTYFVGVPRVYNRIYNGILSKVNGGTFIRKYLFNTGFEAKMKSFKEGKGSAHPFWDRLVFNRVRAALGGRIERMLTGSAPLNGEVLDFLSVCFNVEFFEGYGSTEVTGAASLTRSGDLNRDHVGPINPFMELKLRDVPEMGYYTNSNQPKGEIMVRGPNVIKGYYKNEEKWKESLDEDGFYATGDIGTFTKQYTLKIIDRKAHIFKLSQGEFVSPERVEGVYLSHQAVQMVWVYGDPNRNCLVGVAVPDPDTFVPWARSIGGDRNATVAELCEDSNIRDTLIQDLINYGNQSRLAGFEKVKAFILEPEPFNVDNGLATATMKLKRPALKEYYKDRIDEIYTNIPSN